MSTIKIKFQKEELFRRAALVLEVSPQWIVSVFPAEGGCVFYVVYWGKQYQYSRVEETKKITIWELIAAAPIVNLSGGVESMWARGFHSLLEILQIKEVPRTEKDLKAAYRQAAKKAHPDQGGDVHTFRELRAAYESLLIRVRFGR